MYGTSCTTLETKSSAASCCVSLCSLLPPLPSSHHNGIFPTLSDEVLLAGGVTNDAAYSGCTDKLCRCSILPIFSLSSIPSPEKAHPPRGYVRLIPPGHSTYLPSFVRFPLSRVSPSSDVFDQLILRVSFTDAKIGVSRRDLASLSDQRLVAATPRGKDRRRPYPWPLKRLEQVPLCLSLLLFSRFLSPGSAIGLAVFRQPIRALWGGSAAAPGLSNFLIQQDGFLGTSPLMPIHPRICGL